jgi:hypothetical protein
MTLPLVSGVPEEELALFNPAFLAVMAYNTTREYAGKTDSSPIPFEYLYLILPLALHEATRAALPNSVATQMAVWTQGNPLLLVNLPARVRALRPLVGDACCFALQHGVLLGSGTGLNAGRVRRKTRTVSFTADADQCIARAAFLGRWFAGQSDVATTLAIWGLRP